MKILVTGMTNLQSGAIARRRRDYISTIMVLVEALKKCGYDVDWRPIRWGESLKKYDLTLLGISELTSVSCVRTFHALWATKYKHLIFVNDWKVKGAFQQMRIDYAYKPYFFRRTASYYTPEEVKMFMKSKEKIAAMLSIIKHEENIFAPLFNWGNKDILLKGTMWENVLSYDPTPFYFLPAHFSPIQVEGRKKKWVCGALYDYSKQLAKWNLRWPVIMHTSKTYIPEEELVREYRENLGVISPHYYSAGSGWFRFRFLHALMTNALLRADEREVKGLEWPYTDMSRIEKEGPTNIKSRIKKQREAFMEHVNTREKEIRCLKDTIEGVV